MKILLINPPLAKIIESDMPKELESGMDFLPPLSLLYLAGYLQKNTPHQVKVLDCPMEDISNEEIVSRIVAEDPDAIGITVLTFSLIDVYLIAQAVRKANPQIKIILGGPHTYLYPEETINNDFVDYLVVGEGEIALAELLDNLDNPEKTKNIKGLIFKEGGKIINTGKRELIQDLDSLPFPARELTPYKKYYSIVAQKNPTTIMFTSRGCPYQCLFCDRPHMGKAFRARSAPNVVAEMEEIKKLGIKEIFIYDDTFTIDRQRVIDICRLIIQKGLKINWDVRARVNTVDEELLKLMKKASCTRIHYGVEAGTEKILKILRKDISMPMVKKAFALTKKAGIETAGYFMIGSPHETEADIKATIKLAKKLFPDYVHFSVLTLFPAATDLYLMGKKEGVFKEDFWQKFALDPKPDFLPPVWDETFSRKELFSMVIAAYRSYYLAPRYILRRILELRSWNNLKNNLRAGIKLLKLIIKNSPFYRPLKTISKKYYFLISLVLVVIIAKEINWTATIQLLKTMNYALMLFGMLLTVPYLFVRAWRWNYLKKKQGIVYKIMESFKIYIAALGFASVTPGRIAELIKIYYLKAKGYKSGESLVSVIMDRLFDLFFLLLFSLVGLIFFFSRYLEKFFLLYLVIILLILAALLAIKNKFFRKFIEKIFYRLMPAGLTSEINSFKTGLKTYNYKTYFIGFLITALSWVIYSGQIYFFGQAINLTVVSFPELITSVAIASFLSLLPISFLGIGTREAALIILLGPLVKSTESLVLLSEIILLNFILTSLWGAIMTIFKPVPFKKINPSP
ncbi:MAG: flippase-like domain-containing protein [Patescibacteria group bacterium]